MSLYEIGSLRKLSLEDLNTILERDGKWHGVSDEYSISTVDDFYISKEGNTYTVKVNCFDNEAFVKGIPNIKFACDVLEMLASNLRRIGYLWPVDPEHLRALEAKN
jgi:hypothetical protein